MPAKIGTHGSSGIVCAHGKIKQGKETTIGVEFTIGQNIEFQERNMIGCTKTMPQWTTGIVTRIYSDRVFIDRF